MTPQRHRQPKLTSIAAAVAALDERRLQASQRAQARRENNQRPFCSIDETEIIPTPPLPRPCTAVATTIRNTCNLAFVLDPVPVPVPVPARARARACGRLSVFVLASASVLARLSAHVSASASPLVSEAEMSLLSSEIEQLKIDEDENDEEKKENEENDVCNNLRIVVKVTLRVDKKVV
jgi:hypothetical protein